MRRRLDQRVNDDGEIHGEYRRKKRTSVRSTASNSSPLETARIALESPTLATCNVPPLRRAHTAVVPDFQSSMEGSRCNSVLICLKKG